MKISKLFLYNFFDTRDEIKLNWKKETRDDESKNELFSSIVDNLFYLLNTQSGIKVEDYLVQDLDVTNYGIPDFSPFISINYVDSNLIEKCLKKACLFFETRIKDIKIDVVYDTKKPIVYLSIKIENDNNDFKKALFIGV